MSSLFLDTSNQICIGLLNKDLEWVEFKIIKEAKASKALHGLIQEILNAHNLDLKSIENVFYMSGPGSYTGVRVAHGLCEVLKWQSMKVFSCRHFDIPTILNIPRGLFVSKAFKKEIFIYEWENDTTEQRLIPEDELVECGNAFTCDPESFPGLQSTYDLIKERPKEIFSRMLGRSMNSEVFYYRTLDQEFKKSKS
ncbi:MAG: hypothetical protein CME64_04835 [Halobacteriovoraceae bacterium]|nr:hypothetical protein [Halobacteriovoraceae bacterium]|tara:strand:- start:258728 stop:259315 length:588 start_codon:yes stop_codon:yes gene_type:complete